MMSEQAIALLATIAFILLVLTGCSVVIAICIYAIKRSVILYDMIMNPHKYAKRKDSSEKIIKERAERERLEKLSSKYLEEDLKHGGWD